MWTTLLTSCLLVFCIVESAKTPGLPLPSPPRPLKPRPPLRVFQHRDHSLHRTTPSPKQDVDIQSTPDKQQIPIETPGQRISKSSNDFGMLVLKSLFKDQNAVISPVSLSKAFGMLYAGASGDTKSEMSDVLQYSSNNLQSSEVPQGFKEVSTLINTKSNRGYSLNIANGVYVQNGYNLTQYYINTVRRAFDADVRSADFAKYPQQATADINKWASSATRGLIPKVLDSEFSRTTKLVLLNAVYFKGFWKKPFSVRATFQTVFFNKGFTEKMVDMMYMRSDFRLLPLEDVQAQVLQLPYEGEDTSMLVVLPNNNDGLESVMKKLSIRSLLESMPTAKNLSLDFYFPKFELESSYELKEHLFGAGMRKVFQEGAADLSGIDGSHSLALSEALHKAKIKVDERGTEATAITTLPVVNYSSHPFFTVDHPFLFFIVHHPTNCVLFSGKVVEL